MKLLIGIILLVLLIAGLGYFAILNSHNVVIHLYGSFTLHFAVWSMILGSIGLGFLFSETRGMLFHPERWVQRLRCAWSKREDSRRQQRFVQFQKAWLAGNYPAMGKFYQIMKDDPDTPMYLRIQHLELLRFFEKPDALMSIYRDALETFPKELELQLSFFKMLVWLEKWDLLEDQAIHMKKLMPDHPEVLEGMRLLTFQRQDWLECVRLEKRIIEEYPGYFSGSNLYIEHPKHLKEAITHNPNVMKDWDWNYLKTHLPRQQIMLLSRSSKIEVHRSQGHYLEASEKCARLFQETGELELLQLWESLFLESGKLSETVEFLDQMHKSRKRNAYASLMLAKAHCLRGDYEKAGGILAQISWPEEAIPELHQALDYLIALQSNQDQELPLILARWLPEQRILQTPIVKEELLNSSSKLLEMSTRTLSGVCKTF